MRHADFLSRNPLPDAKNVCGTSTSTVRLNKLIEIANLQENWLSVEQQRDDEITQLVTKLRMNEAPSDLSKTYDVRDKILFRKIQRNGKSKWLPVIPRSMAWSIINHIHIDLKHLGWEKTLDKLYDFYWFPNMSKNVRKFVDNCLICKSSKGKTGAQQAVLHSIPKVAKPWHTVHIDISGKLSGKSDKKEYVFVIVDAFSKFVVLYQISKLTGKQAVECFQKFSYLFGAPSRVISDQGKCFTSSEFRLFCSENNIDLHFIAHCSSRANGQVERVMQTLKNMFTAIESEGNKTWQESVGEVQLALNSSKHKTTGFSPAEVLFGCEIHSLELNKLLHKSITDNEVNASLNEIRAIADKNICKMAAADSKRFNAGKAKVKPFAVGDFLFAKSNERMLSKLDSKFRGPYKVVKVLENDRYEVEKVGIKGKGR